MKKHTLRLLAVSTACFALHSAHAADTSDSSTTAATVSTATTTGSTGVAIAALPASRIASRFESLAGSPENAASLVAGLRSGSEITLTATDTANGISFTPATQAMGYGNITQALALAQRQLAAQGITQATPEQLQIALNGGSVTAIDAGGASRIVEVPGVLQLRSEGMGWGRIAHQFSLSPSLRTPALALPTRSGAPATSTSTPATATTASNAAAVKGSATLRGSSYSRGAIVSGDGAIMQERVPGYAGVGDHRASLAGAATAHAGARAAVHARLPVTRTDSSVSFGGGYASGATASHGKGAVHGRSGSRL